MSCSDTSTSLSTIRRKVLTYKRGWEKYGGEWLALFLECGHTLLISRPPERVPKTTQCSECSKLKK